MLNYIKSELYRVSHGKEVYLFTGILAVLSVLMNGVLYLFHTFTPDFPYGAIRFSLNTLTSSMEFLFFAGMLLAGFLISDEHKNGTLKNTVSFGITRVQIFTGKCIVCSIASFLSMLVIMTFYYGSAYLILTGPDEVTLLDRLRGIAANLPMAFASVILIVALMSMIKREMIAVMVWMFIIVFLPIITFFLGLKIDWLNSVAEWMPRNYLNMEVIANMSDYQALWDTPEGMAKCLISGIIGMIVFFMIGWIGFRKKELV